MCSLTCKKLPIVEENRKTEREKYEEKVRHLWERASVDELDAYSSIIGSLRIERTFDLLKRHIPIEGKNIVDLGCGVPRLAELVVDHGGIVTALDVTEKGFHKSKHSNIKFEMGCLPYVRFKDKSFDGAIFTDVIAEIDPHLYRLSLSEIARVLKRDAWILCSTPLDIYSHDAKQQFLCLLETEFKAIASCQSYHRFYTFLSRLIKPEFWSRKLILIAEHLSEIFWGASSITHLIVLAQKKKI